MSDLFILLLIISESISEALTAGDGDISALTCRESDRYRAAASAEDGMT